MTFKFSEIGSISAFIVTTLMMIGYVSLIFPILDMLNVPVLLANFVAAWLPVLLSFVMYVLLKRNAMPSKRSLYLGACATALFAPPIAWQLYLFVGFAFLGWQM